MILIRCGKTIDRNKLAEATMFADRKAVFSDILKWNVSIVQSKFEIDQFDLDSATYIIVADADGKHLASARLLPTSGDHILGSVFPNLCDGPLPVGENIFEITRFCLSPSKPARDRMVARKKLVTALAEYGISTGITAYTGVAEKSWFDQIASFGWKCGALSDRKLDSRIDLVGLRIDLDEQTIGDLRAGDMYLDAAWESGVGSIAA